MKQKKQRHLRGIVAAILTTIVMVATISAIPKAGWLQLGQQAAIVAAGWRQPINTVLALTNEEPPLSDEELLKEVTSITDEFFSPIYATSSPLKETAQTPEGGGTVIAKQYSAFEGAVQGVAVNNKSGVATDIAAALRRNTGIVIESHTAPQVLITHTHTTECYLTHDDGIYASTDETRSHDNRKTVVAVGEAVAAQLRQAGIGVIHDTIIHDEPYTGAYGSSKAEVERLLKEYPTIRVVLDIHRDAIYPDASTRVKPTAVIGGKKAAQVMIVVGMKNSKTVPNPHVAVNFALGAQLQQEMHYTYEGLARPILLADARYNQQLQAGSLLIEVGSDANTAEEAIYAGELLGKSLVQVLKK